MKTTHPDRTLCFNEWREYIRVEAAKHPELAPAEVKKPLTLNENYVNYTSKQ